MTSTEKDIRPETIALMSDKEKPVVLSPGWEAYNMPEEQLNFADLSMKDAHLQLNPPKDRLKLIYLILIVHGIGVLMPWNMFINAKDYFMAYKLSKTYTGIDVTYLPKFMFYLQVSAQLPNFIFQWCNVYIRFGGKLSVRIVWSIIVLLVLFVFTTLMAMIDSSSWPNLFFWMTMITNVAINTASGIYQNTLYGLAAKLPANYAGAIVLGNNISGAFTSIVNILSAGTTSNYRTAAIYYFITAIFVLLVCFNTYFGMPLNRFYRYYDQLGESDNKKSTGTVQSTKQSIPYMRIFKQASPQLFNVFFIFFVTLTLFPDVSSNIKRSQDDFFIGSDLYMNILCFLSFNVCTVIGSYLATVFQWPKPENLKYVVMLRFIFVPLFLLCNYQPVNVTRTMPVLITSDWAYWLIAIMMATSSGYFSSIAMQSCPGQVAPEHAPIAGMFAGAMLISGIFAGILSSFFWPILVQIF